MCVCVCVCACVRACVRACVWLPGWFRQSSLKWWLLMLQEWSYEVKSEVNHCQLSPNNTICDMADTAPCSHMANASDSVADCWSVVPCHRRHVVTDFCNHRLLRSVWKALLGRFMLRCWLLYIWVEFLACGLTVWSCHDVSLLVTLSVFLSAVCCCCCCCCCCV